MAPVARGMWTRRVGRRCLSCGHCKDYELSAHTPPPGSPVLAKTFICTGFISCWLLLTKMASLKTTTTYCPVNSAKISSSLHTRLVQARQSRQNFPRYGIQYNVDGDDDENG